MKRSIIIPPGKAGAGGAEGPAASLLSGAGDRIELMQTFVRIVEAGNLSAAAVLLGTTQPTVSRRLQALERSLGVRLLQRSTHTMRLTVDGERCFQRAKELLASWAAFESDLRGAGEAPEGVLRVVAPHAFGQERLIAPLVDYLKRCPHVSVDWLLHDDSAIQDFIAAGVDCAIQVGEVSDSALVAIRLAEVPRIVVVAPSLLEAGELPQQPIELARLPWVALRTYYQHEVALRHVGSDEVQRLAIAPRLSTDSLYALRSAVLQGLGVGIGSAWVLADDLAAGRLVQLVPRWQASALPVSLVYPYARFYPARLRHFIEAMRAGAPSALMP
jgi:DNA-binding transcriptional LysR family regulator